MLQFRLTRKQLRLLAEAQPKHIELTGEGRIEYHSPWRDSTDEPLQEMIRLELIFPDVQNDPIEGTYVVLTPRGLQFRKKAIDLLRGFD